MKVCFWLEVIWKNVSFWLEQQQNGLLFGWNTKKISDLGWNTKLFKNSSNKKQYRFLKKYLFLVGTPKNQFIFGWRKAGFPTNIQTLFLVGIPVPTKIEGLVNFSFRRWLWAEKSETRKRTIPTGSLKVIWEANMMYLLDYFSMACWSKVQTMKQKYDLVCASSQKSFFRHLKSV